MSKTWIIGTCIAVLGIVISFTQPELRKLLGLDDASEISQLSYDQLLSNIYSYKEAIGPPPNVGVMTGGILGLKDYPEKKEQSLVILNELKDDAYLKNPVFESQYKALMKIIFKTENQLKYK